jgi:Tfp pilus assembly PilM family ATPase/Tfp pilus assembly protein PilN
VVEITGEYLKVVQADAREVFFCEVIGISGMKDIEISSRLGATVKRFVRGKNLEVVGVIPRRSVIVRFFSLPSLDPAEIEQMVRLQAFQSGPYSGKEAVADFTVVSQTKSGYTKVMVVIAPQDVFSRVWSICAKAGLAVSYMTTSSEGVAAWLTRATAFALVTAAVDIDDSGSEICISEKGRLLTSRQIPQGLRDLETAGAAGIVRQLELTLAGYDKEGLSNPVLRVMLTAGPAGSTDRLADAVSHSLGMPFELLGCVEKVPAARKLAWPGIVHDGKVSVTAVCGLALSTARPAVNLIPAEIQEARQKRRDRMVMLRSCAIFLLGLGFLAAAASLPLFERNSELDALERKYKELKPQVAAVEALREESEALEQAFAGRIFWAEVVEELYSFIPKDLFLQSLGVSGRDKLIFKGYSVDREAADVFQKALGLSPMFRDVKLELMNKRWMPSGEVNYFEITCTIASPHEEVE